MSGENAILLSVILRVVGGGVFLRRCLNHLVRQAQGRPIEIIAPYDSTVKGVDQLREDFPEVTFVDMGLVKTETPPDSPELAHELYDRRTAKGLRIARGKILALLEDYGLPDPDWCSQIFEAHQLLPYGVIGGAIEHGGKGALNWAVYLLDFGRYQLPLREGPVDYLSDVNVSYKREVLESVKELWSERYNEVTVHWALIKQGLVLWQRPQMVVRQNRGRLSFSDLIVERFWWGRLFAATRTRGKSFIFRLLYIILSPIIPMVLLARTVWRVCSRRRNRTEVLLSFPQMVVMATFWCLGEFTGYVTGRESSL